MSAGAFIRIATPTGTPQAILTGDSGGYLSLVWRLQRNGVHYCEFRLNADNPASAYLVDKAQIQVVRAYPEVELAPYTSFDGMIRTVLIADDDNGVRTITVRAYGLVHMLSWRYNLYYAGANNLSSYVNVPAEDVYKQLVHINFGSAALVVNGRDRDANVTDLGFATNLHRGNLLTVSCARDNVLSIIQKYAGAQAGGDFDVIRISPTLSVLEFYPNQRGTDRSASVIFSMDRANMANPRLTMDRAEEKTVAVVGGQGEGIARTVATATSANYSASNQIETFVDASGLSLVASLQARGAQELYKLQYRAMLEYDVLQTENYAVEKHYYLGDKVTAIYGSYSGTQIVDTITFSYQEDREIVTVSVVSV